MTRLATIIQEPYTTFPAGQKLLWLAQETKVEKHGRWLQKEKLAKKGSHVLELLYQNLGSTKAKDGANLRDDH